MAREAQEWSISALSKEFGLDRRTVTKRVAGIKPCRKTKVGNLYRMVDVAVPILMPGLSDGGESESNIQSLELEKARVAHFQAREKELIVARLEGSLVDRGDVSRILNGIIFVARSHILGLGSRIAPSACAAAAAGPGSVQGVIDEAAHEILETMAATDLEDALADGSGQ